MMVGEWVWNRWRKMVLELLERLFRRKPKRRMSLSDYRKHHERELKRNPSRFEREQEQVRRWSMRVTNEGCEKERKPQA